MELGHGVNMPILQSFQDQVGDSTGTGTEGKPISRSAPIDWLEGHQLVATELTFKTAGCWPGRSRYLELLKCKTWT